MVGVACRAANRIYSCSIKPESSIPPSVSRFSNTRWNLLSEKGWTASSPSVTNTYVWGLDLSGSLQGAGGIGALLASIGGAGSPSTPVFYTFDGNGNVSEVVQISSNEFQISAHYEYSPFGETIVSTGPKAKDFAHRFSTKPAEDNTGLVLYEYRPYSPSLGRWLSRDPIGERGGLNVYCFVENSTIRGIDPLGLFVSSAYRSFKCRNSTSIEAENVSWAGWEYWEVWGIILKKIVVIGPGVVPEAGGEGEIWFPPENGWIDRTAVENIDDLNKFFAENPDAVGPRCRTRVKCTADCKCLCKKNNLS